MQRGETEDCASLSCGHDTHTLIQTKMKLTHSTTLTKPRGSFSGDRLSLNPVIMTKTASPVVVLWMLVQGRKSGSCLTLWRGFTFHAVKKLVVRVIWKIEDVHRQKYSDGNDLTTKVKYLHKKSTLQILSVSQSAANLLWWKSMDIFYSVEGKFLARCAQKRRPPVVFYAANGLN